MDLNSLSDIFSIIGGAANPDFAAKEAAAQKAAFAKTQEMANPQVQEDPRYVQKAARYTGLKREQVAPTETSVADVIKNKGMAGIEEMVAQPGRIKMSTNPFTNETTSTWVSWPTGPKPDELGVVARAEMLKTHADIKNNPELLNYVNAIASKKVEKLTPVQAYADITAKAAKLKEVYPKEDVNELKIQMANNLGYPGRDEWYWSLAYRNIMLRGESPTKEFARDEFARLKQINTGVEKVPGEGILLGNIRRAEDNMMKLRKKIDEATKNVEMYSKNQDPYTVELKKQALMDKDSLESEMLAWKEAYSYEAGRLIKKRPTMYDSVIGVPSMTRKYPPSEKLNGVIKYDEGSGRVYKCNGVKWIAVTPEEEKAFTSKNPKPTIEGSTSESPSTEKGAAPGKPAPVSSTLPTGLSKDDAETQALTIAANKLGLKPGMKWTADQEQQVLQETNTILTAGGYQTSGTSPTPVGKPTKLSFRPGIYRHPITGKEINIQTQEEYDRVVNELKERR